jgi:endonuclease/exonuclease/phosphatase (EEP) superfamily protein YafD
VIRQTWSATARIGQGLGWALAAGLVAVVAVRFAGSVTIPVLIGVQGVAVWALVAAYPLAAWAGIAGFRGAARTEPAPPGRSSARALTLVAAALVAVQLVSLVTALSWQGSQAAPAGAIPVRVVSANILLDNDRIGDLAAELVASDADVIVLQEVTPEHLASMQGSDLWATYEHRLAHALPGYQGGLILSRFAFSTDEVVDLGGSPMLRATIQTPSGALDIIDMHASAPINAENTAVWLRQLDELTTIAADTSLPHLVIGDFNATLDHEPLRRVVASGLRDAVREAGWGYGATWPRWDGVIPSLMRLDHALVSAEVSVLSVTTQTSAGSDHRRLVVDLSLPPGR